MNRYSIILLLLCITLRAGAQGREILPINDGWQFFFKSEGSSDNARLVTLPHSWNSAVEANFIETTANYQNDIFISSDWAAKRIFIKFYGVQSVADVFVNGSHIANHKGGAAAFTFEITDKVRFGTDNAVLVVVSNSRRSDVLPTSTDINLYGGIYREAELIITDKTAISPLYLGTDGVFIHQKSVTANRVDAEAEVHLISKGDKDCVLTLDVFAPDGKNILSKKQKARIDGKSVTIPFSIDNPQLWSAESPSLYQITVSIGENRVSDRVAVRTGFRKIATTPSGGFTLNGRRTPIRGVALYHDNLLSGGALINADYDADLQQIEELGANAIRSAVMPHSQYLYNRCDEQGVLVWVDIPLHRASFLGDIAYFATAQFEQNGAQQLQEIIAQNYNHPSVVMWGIFSRLWTRGDNVIPYIKRLNDTARGMDSSRPTVANSDQDGDINFITDLIVWQQDVGWNRGLPSDIAIWRDRLHRNWGHLRSGVSYGGGGFISHPNQPTTVVRANWMPEERQRLFHEEYAKNLQNDSLFWGVWINNMYDYGSARLPYSIEGSGLVTIDRRTNKDAYYLYKALWNSRKPTLHIADKRSVLRNIEPQSFTVYSSCGEPKLTVGGNRVAMTEFAPCQYRSDTITLRQGIVEIEVSAGDLRDRTTIRVGNFLRPRRSPLPR